ncbi:MAG TPA: hypothetical protein VFA57_04215 [Pseudolabrys sp.]|nr:hypothetical protein [Pseudolabrys sp.]
MTEHAPHGRSLVPVHERADRQRVSWLLIGLAIAAAAAMLAIAVAFPRIAAAGWLIAFVYVSSIAFGSLELSFIYRLTGGHWGEALRPFFERAAVCIPLLAILFIPVLIAIPSLYPWTAGRGDIKPDVIAYYLNSGSFIGRTVFTFVVFGAVALLLPRIGGKPGTLLAAAGFVLYAFMISLVSIDWILSAEPVFISTSFGASIAITQILAALAFCALAGPIPDERAARDVGGLTLAVVLGLTYIDFMAVLVLWYGDLPDKIDWFVRRGFAPWKWLAVFAFAFGSVFPILALLLERVRASRAALRAVGLCILIGLAFYDSYLLAPAYGAWALGAAALAVLALGCALILFIELGCSSALLPRARLES